jgi:hypothetical protein
VKSKADQHKLSKSKEYDLKIREFNKRNQTSIIKSAQRILYSSRSVKNHELSGRKPQDEAFSVKGQSVSSFVQEKAEAQQISPSKLNKQRSTSKSKLEANTPKGAQRVKPEGSLCIHRKGYNPTPADLECTFKPSINKQSRFLDEKKQRLALSPTVAGPRHEGLLNKVG